MTDFPKYPHNGGPWTLEPHFAKPDYWWIGNADTMIAEVPAYDETAESDARLIAAAPDLLEALESVLTGDGANCLAYGTDTPAMRRRFAEINRIASEAIRKAKGE